jgi:transposase-like protein
MIKKYNPIKDNVVDKIDEMRKEINRLSKLKNKIKVIETKPRFQYPICPKCKSKNVKKAGVRKNLERGDTQRFRCKDCDFHFTPKTMEYRMRVSENKLNRAFELRHQGLSYSQIAKRVKGVSRQTIMRWLKKYKIPLKEREVMIEQKNQYGKYKRRFKIKC